MSVLIINGDPGAGKEPGNDGAWSAADALATLLEQRGLVGESIRLGAGTGTRDCVGCGLCRGSGVCVYGLGGVAGIAERLAAASALVLVAPLAHAGADGLVPALLRRLFHRRGRDFARKPALVVVHHRPGRFGLALERLGETFSLRPGSAASRRTRAEAALERLCGFCLAAHMPVAGAVCPRETGPDAADAQEALRAAVDDLAWLVRCIAARR